MAFRKGALVSLHGSFGSGLAMLTVDEEVPGGAPRQVSIPCEVVPTIRALRSAFGDEVAGQDVLFFVDTFGILVGFAPLRDADGRGEAKVAGPNGKAKGKR